jgi:hypothetical protein
MEEYLYLDLESDNGKEFLRLSYEFLNDPICTFIDPNKNCDIIEIFKLNETYYLEMNYFLNGKYYLHTVRIPDNWFKSRIRDKKLNNLLKDE